MKASLKFREDQKPLFRAKIPLNLLGFPFQSGIVAGDSKELSLNLTTFFQSGPSLKVAYRPNDSLNPFSLVFKTGIGHFGSPISSAMNMSAEFNLIGGSQNPSFFVHFKPQFGDFTVKKTQSPVFNKAKLTSDGEFGAEDEHVLVDLLEDGKQLAISPFESPAAGVIKSVLSDLEVSARTAVPLRKRATINFRWGVRFPAAATAVLKKNYPFEKLPLLMINKIGIEHVAHENCRDSSDVAATPNDAGNGDVAAAACLGVKRQLEIIQAENCMLRKAIDDLKSEFFSVKKNSELNGHFGGKAMEDELVNEDLKKGSITV